MDAEPGELVFEENWDDFNMDIWQHEMTLGGGGNWEFQGYYNNRSNSYVRDNTLYLMPTTLADAKGICSRNLIIFYKNSVKNFKF